MLDYYRILNVSSDINQSELKKAYLKRLKKYHPDVYRGSDATEKTQKINEAYQTLKDAQKRAAYDRELASAYNKPKSSYQNTSGYSSYSSQANSKNQREFLAYLLATFRQRQEICISQCHAYAQQALKKFAKYVDAGGEYYSILEVIERDFRAFRSQLLRENALYYQQYSNAAANFTDEVQIMQLSAQQEAFIKQTTRETWQIVAAQLNQFYRNQTSNRRNSDFNKIFNVFFWSGFILSLVFPLLIFIAAFAVYIFGTKTPAKIRFLAGSFIGFIIQALFIAA